MKKTIEKELISRMLELNSLVGSVENMTNEKLQDNPPRHYRLKIIHSLMKSLGLTCSLNDLFSGKFINQSFEKNWSKIEEGISKFDNSIVDSNNRYETYTAIHNYNSLFKYRINLEKLITHNSGVYVASNNFKYPILITKKLNKSIIKTSDILDEILGCFLNPNKINYTKKELIEKFNFPDVDLSKIDIDWI